MFKKTDSVLYFISLCLVQGAKNAQALFVQQQPDCSQQVMCKSFLFRNLSSCCSFNVWFLSLLTRCQSKDLFWKRRPRSKRGMLKVCPCYKYITLFVPFDVPFLFVWHQIFRFQFRIFSLLVVWNSLIYARFGQSHDQKNNRVCWRKIAKKWKIKARLGKNYNQISFN